MSTTLNKMKAPKGANKKMKRVGRGESSGHGKTSTRGGKGQTARKGNSKPRLGFEGGQTPYYRRLPKRGFKNFRREDFAVVNVDTLEASYKAGETVDEASLREKGLVHGRADGVRILGDGALAKKLTVKARGFSASAKEKIEKAGGTVEIVK
ncbi:MAG: 50S ribosomal protein L15 [Deltaproteobacteria bacterium]|nr:50S ribosomal protein L15 [Deltaproteobacteria bacterium]